MNRPEFFAKWSAETELLRRHGALVRGAELCDELLADVAAMLDGEGNELLTVAEAARRSGYSADHLGRLVRLGSIPNAGRINAPRIRVSDLPRKSPKLAVAPSWSDLPGASTRQIVRAVVTSNARER
jgi:hypothetical protein